MTSLRVTARDGTVRVLDAVPGQTVMEVVRDGGVDEMLALCGGCCSCATCHVFVDPAHVERLPPLGADEDALLSSSSHRRANSRLACQLPFEVGLDGLAVTLAPED